MTIVIKIGGAALEDTVTLRKCARAIAELAQDGHRVAVVHGGGSALTRVLKQLGKQSEFVSGLRVTDAETRDVALMVLGGMVNKKLVAAIQAAGMPAVGFCGGDGMSFRARRKHVAGNDLGYVGELLCRALLDRSALAPGRHPSSRLIGAGRRWRILQRECGRDGCRVCSCLPCERPDLSHRRPRRQRCLRGSDSLAEHERSTGSCCRLGHQWRHVAEISRVYTGTEAGSRTREDFAGC